MKYIFGPVPSRRLGQSLGVDPIPSKTCNYQCIYCQLGKTTNFTNERKNYYPKTEIIDEIKQVVAENQINFDYLTFVGSGEPTLYKDLGELIESAKIFTAKPLCVITNGSLLYKREVRSDLCNADVVLPTLDAGDEKAFRLINRPHPEIEFNKFIEGFIKFRKIFKGKFWVEIMLVRNVNDSEQALYKIKEKLDLIQPDRIDINVPIRPPAENWVQIPDKSIFKRLNNIFGEYKNINFPEKGVFTYHSTNFEQELLSIIERHPMREKNIYDTFSSELLTKKEIKKRLNDLEQNQKLIKIVYNHENFWKLKTIK